LNYTRIITFIIITSLTISLNFNELSYRHFRPSTGKQVSKSFFQDIIKYTAFIEWKKTRLKKSY